MKTITKIAFFSILFLSLFSEVKAQLKVGNNPTTLNPSAALEVEATNKGFLPPRVALTGTKDVTTIPSPVAGLLVINTTAAGSGATAVLANTLYIWDGTQWNRIVTNGSNTSNNTSTPFAVGEIRTVMVSSPVTTFITYLPSATTRVMNGKAANNSTTTNKKSAFETATNNPNWITIRGLRMDFLHAGLNLDGDYDTFVSPKLYNTTSNPITYNISSLSTYDRYHQGAGTTIAGQHYSYFIDGNDIFAASTNGFAEYINAMLTFPDGEWYILTWHATVEPASGGDIMRFYMTAQRLN